MDLTKEYFEMEMAISSKTRKINSANTLMQFETTGN